MLSKKCVLLCLSVLLIGFAGCSRQQSDWQKTRESNTPEAYEQFLKKYPSGEFTAQAQARLKELDEERDWQKARDTDTLDAYQAFLKQYPDGKNTEEARIRVENFTLAQTPTGAGVQGGTTGAQGGPAGAPQGSGAPPEAAPPGTSATGSTGPTAAAMEGTPSAAPSAATAPGTRPAETRKSRPAAPAAEAREPKVSAGKYAVQLGAFKSGTEAANQRWERLRKEYPQLFAGLSSKVAPKKIKGGTLYRLQAVGMSEAHARKICKDLKARSQPCVIVRPS
jgi:cell division protein FtsN